MIYCYLAVVGKSSLEWSKLYKLSFSLGTAPRRFDLWLLRLRVSLDDIGILSAISFPNR